jgi:MFS family permease
VTLASNHRPLQIGLILAVSLHAFDEMVITIALPTIVRELGGGDLYGVSLASYILASLISVVWAGKSIDRRGPVRIFLIGYGLFALGLVMATIASSMGEFILARAVQGLGGGITWTVAYAVTNIVIPSDQRPKMIAWLDSAWLIPSLLAPSVGGYVIDYLDWHWIFVGQLPFVVLATFLLYPHLTPLTRISDVSSESSHQAIFQALRIAIGAGILVTVLAQPLDWTWLIYIPLALVIIVPPFAAVMPAGFFNARAGLPAAVVLHFLIFFAFYAAEMFTPRMLIELRGASSSVTGLAFTCCALAWIGASFLQAWLSSRIGVRQSLLWGMIITFTGLVLTATPLLPDTPYWFVFIAWAVAGVGMGMAYNTVVSATMDFTAEGKEGATSTANGIASALSVGLAAGIGGAITNHSEFSGGSLDEALAVIWVMAGVACLLGTAIVLARFKSRKTS